VKVIFLEDVTNVAKAGETREVADGYGRNFLIPRNLAVLAGSSASNMVEAQLKKQAKRQAETEAEMLELAVQLEGKEIILKARTGAKERLYGSITSTDIVAELSNSTGLVIDKRKVELAESIRQLGSYDVTIRLTKDVTPKIKLTVVGEEVEEKDKEEEKKGKEKGEEKEKKDKEGEEKDKEEEKEGEVKGEVQ